MDELPQKNLIIAIIEKDDTVLMRKKSTGSPPYKETWYLFGCEPIEGQNDAVTLKNYLKFLLNIDVTVTDEIITDDLEVKTDHDGIKKQFVYRNLHCHYVSGNPNVPAGIERVEWIPRDKIKNYDIVPPSIKLLRKINYLD